MWGWILIALVVLTVLAGLGGGNPLLGLVGLGVMVGLFWIVTSVEKRYGSKVAALLVALLLLLMLADRLMHPPSFEDIEREDMARDRSRFGF